MDVEKAICVIVGESRKIVQGLTPETTAEDVITALKGSCGKSTPQVQRLQCMHYSILTICSVHGNEPDEK